MEINIDILVLVIPCPGKRRISVGMDMTIMFEYIWEMVYETLWGRNFCLLLFFIFYFGCHGCHDLLSMY